MKVRVFALAKELGVDSKELIQYCNDVGIAVKSSALASITPEQRDQVVAYYEEQVKSGGPVSEPTESGMTPVRAGAAAEKIGKVRTLQARSAKMRAASGKAAEITEEPPEAVDESETSEAEPTEAPVEEEVAAEEKTATVSETTEPVAEKDEPEKKTPSKIQAISRDDYTPAGGSRLREMKPIGSVSGEQESQQRQKPKPKPKSQTPSIAAAPQMKLQRAKKKPVEETAQKPEIRLTHDLIDQASPLGEQLRKHAEKKARSDEAETDGADKNRKGGRSLIEERRRNKKKLGEEESQVTTRSRPMHRRRRRSKSNIPVELKTEATITMPITLRNYCEAIGRPARDLMRTLMQNGQMITINDQLDEEMALLLAMEHGVELHINQEEDFEDKLDEIYDAEDSAESLVPRPTIVTILGHVDHGKTTLIDKIRAANVASGEAGGITQHIASYQVEHNDHKITFVDTPGHAAFGEMRARGANVTDIIVLVVAADDGVMPQTVECISHARSAGVPIIVAMNKMDLPDINEQRVMQELTQHEILPAEWGGDVEVIRTSGETGKGLDDLLETILLTAELQEYKGNPDRNAIGVCLEAFRDEGRGPIAWMIVKDGTLRIGDCVLCGGAYGRIRAIYNDRNEEISEAPPSTPVKVAGLESVPGAGEKFYVFDDIEQARTIAEERADLDRSKVLARRRKPPTSLEDILGAVREGKIQDLALIIKADSPGSLEAIRGELGKFDHPEVRVKIIHEGVGGVNESDIYLAAASKAVIIAFHVIAEDRAEDLAGQEGVEIRRYTIIYEVIQDIRDALEGMLAPERIEVATGRALVLQTFSVSRTGTIAGCRILNGNIDRNCRVHVIRDQTIINNYSIASLRREKDDVKEVREGMECGIRLDGFNDIKEGDLFESYRVEEKKRTLEDVASST